MPSCSPSPSRSQVRQPFFILLLCAILLPFSAPEPARAASLGILLGARTVTIPLPDGYTLLGRETGPWYEAAEAFVPPSNESHGMFVREDSLLALYRGKPPDFSRSLQVQTPKALRDVEISPAQFRHLKARLLSEIESMAPPTREEMDALAADASRAVTERLGVNTRAALDRMDRPQVLFEDAHSLAFVQTHSQTMRTEANVARQSLVTGMGMVLAGGRVLYLYVHAAPQDEPTLAFVRDMLRGWIHMVVTAN